MYGMENVKTGELTYLYYLPSVSNPSNDPLVCVILSTSGEEFTGIPGAGQSRASILSS